MGGALQRFADFPSTRFGGASRVSVSGLPALRRFSLQMRCLPRGGESFKPIRFRTALGRCTHGHASDFRFAPAVHIVNDQLIGSQLQCKKNGIALPGVEVGAYQLGIRLPLGDANFQLGGIVGGPIADRLRRQRAPEFVADRRRDHDALIKSRQQFYLADPNQIAERTGVGDDDHPAGCSISALASLSAMIRSDSRISCSRSSTP